jgi:hypothetical protein
MSTVQTLPWTMADVVPHEDIRKGELAMDTYAADLASVARDDPHAPRVYRDPRAFFEATYLTASLRSLLKDVVHVLSGGAGDRVLQLRTPFGGGKTHSLVALYHLAQHRGALAGMSDVANLPDPGPTRVAVLAGIELDPTSGRQTPNGGPLLRTLWGELAWQLGGRELYELVREQDQNRTAPGGEVLRRVLDGQPTLLLLDEVLVYVQKALNIIQGDTSYGRQVMVFLQTLTEVVRGLPRAAMVYSLQASAAEAFGDEGVLADLDKLVGRIDAKREPVSGDEVLRVVQRRLFENLGKEETRRTVASTYADLHRRVRENLATSDTERREAAAEAEQLEERILASYPFHPALIDLMYYRWGTLPSYQRTRGALQFLAQVIHAQWHGPTYRQVQPLIGPGDAPLEHEGVRGTLFSQVGERETYSSVLASDLTGSTARAAGVDERIAAESPGLSQIKVGTRLATAALLYSFGAREGEDRGIGETDLIMSSLAPGLDRMVLATALGDLRENLLYLHYTGRRYRFETQPNLNKLIADEARKFGGQEVLDRVKDELTARLGAPRGTPIWPPDGQAISDREPIFHVVYLGLDWAEKTQEVVERGIKDLVERRGNGMREFRNALAFAVPGRQAADKARAAARNLLGIESLVNQRTRFGFKPDQVEELRERQNNAGADLNGALRRLYEVVYLPKQADTPTAGGNGGSGPIGLELVDLRAELAQSPQVHARVMGALRNSVFATVTPERIVTLTRLGQPATAGTAGGVQALGAEQLVTYFFSYLGFPRLMNASVLRNAVAEGIEKSRFGYVAGIASTDQNGVPAVSDGRYVKFGGAVRAEELVLEPGAYLLAPSLAQQLQHIGMAATPPSGSALPQAGGTQAAHPLGGQLPGGGQIGNGRGTYTSTPTTIDGGAGVAVSLIGPDARPRRYRLRITGTAVQAFNAWDALSRLAEAAAQTHLTIDVVAEQPAGFDQVWVRNAVLEPLEEANIQVEARAEE